MTAVSRFVTCLGILLGPWVPVAIAQQLAPGDEDQTVTPADVKRFLDPTILTSGVRYDFGYTDQPEGSSQAHVFSLDVSPTAQHVFFTDIPLTRSSVTGETQAGISDISVGYGFVPYENLERRFTTTIVPPLYETTPDMLLFSLLP